MEKIQLINRDLKAKKNKILLKEGLTPAVMYNAKTESTSVMINSSIAKRILREATSTTILDAEFEDRPLKVVVKEIDLNPITEEIRHISFFEIDETKDMVFSIPFQIVGISPAVKNNLGVLVEVMNAIEVRCKVKDLIPFIQVDISKLEHPGQTIAVSELDIPNTISFINDDIKNSTIVTITEMQKEEEIVAPVESVAETTNAEGAVTEGAGEAVAKE